MADNGLDSGRDDHRAAGPTTVRVAILIISDTRTPETDTSGDYLASALLADEADSIRETLESFLAGDAEVVISSGGTGIAGRDVTIPVVESLIKKPMPGFGELFRMLSFQEVKGAAMLSRAVGGLADGGLIFALPGSRNAVKTAWEGLLKDELSHLIFEVFRHKQ